MNFYMISYDIAEQDKKEYEPLWAYLRSINGRKVLYSQWVVTHQGSAAELLNELTKRVKLKPEDGVVVQQMTRDTASTGRLEMQELAFKVLVESISRY